MTKLLHDAIERLKELPEERQNELARMLIDVAASDLAPYVLADEERTAVEEGLAEVERGQIASDEDVAAMWSRFGLV